MFGWSPHARVADAAARMMSASDASRTPPRLAAVRVAVYLAFLRASLDSWPLARAAAAVMRIRASTVSLMIFSVVSPVGPPVVGAALVGGGARPVAASRRWSRGRLVGPSFRPGVARGACGRSLWAGPSPPRPCCARGCGGAWCGSGWPTFFSGRPFSPPSPLLLLMAATGSSLFRSSAARKLPFSL